jgi:hypothetical protein
MKNSPFKRNADPKGRSEKWEPVFGLNARQKAEYQVLMSLPHWDLAGALSARAMIGA